MALACIDNNALPDAGGVDDQDPDKLDAISAVRAKLREAQAKKRRNKRR